MATFRKVELPGIGKKYEVPTGEGGLLVVVVHSEGRRELFHFDDPDGDPVSSVTLGPEEARRVASILEEASPIAEERDKVALVLKNLTIDWVKLPRHSAFDGRTIGELQVRKRTGVAIVAVIHGEECMVNPGPDTPLHAQDTVVLAGRKADVESFLDVLLEE